MPLKTVAAIDGRLCVYTAMLLAIVPPCALKRHKKEPVCVHYAPCSLAYTKQAALTLRVVNEALKVGIQYCHDHNCLPAFEAGGLRRLPAC